MAKLQLQCVGMRHRITPSTMRDMNDACPLRVKIERELDNHHDANAVAVVCIEKPWNDMQIGYISRGTAAELAPRMDEGRVYFTEECYLTSADAASGIGELLLNTSKEPPKVERPKKKSAGNTPI